MTPGDERTRRMEVVVAKMRAIGRAVFPLRYELAASASPGKRLQAIAALEVTQDFDMLDWLAERLSVERPFVGWHALVALNQAARAHTAMPHVVSLQQALKIAEEAKASFGDDTSRHKALDNFKQAVGRLSSSVI